MRAVCLIAILASACTTATGPAAWAVDPMWVEPTDEDGVQGFQTWELFAAGWDNGYNQRHYVCGVVVRIFGSPTTCEGCDSAWDITTRLVETDCTDTETERFLGLERLAFLPSTPAAETEAPYAGQSVIVQAGYGSGWEAYGWGWPSALDNGVASTSGGTFNGTEPFQLRPTLLWDLSL